MLAQYLLNKWMKVCIRRSTLFKPSLPKSISSFVLTLNFRGLGYMRYSGRVSEVLIEGLTFGVLYCSLPSPHTHTFYSHFRSLSSNKNSVWGRHGTLLTPFYRWPHQGGDDRYEITEGVNGKHGPEFSSPSSLLGLSSSASPDVLLVIAVLWSRSRTVT